MPVFHDISNGLLSGESLFIITEALLGTVRSWIGVFERFRRAADRSLTLSVNDSKSHIKDISEVSKLLLVVLLSGEIDMTIASAIIAFIGTSWCLVGWLNFAEALLIDSWHWVSAEIVGTARLPVVSFNGNGLPFSHFIEGLDWSLGVWTSWNTKPHSSWALATFISLGSTLEWLVVLVNDWLLVDIVLVACILPVLFGILDGGVAISAEHAGNFWVFIKISLSLIIGQSLGTGTKSTLLETNGSKLALRVQQSIDVLVACRVASSVLIIKSTPGWNAIVWHIIIFTLECSGLQRLDGWGIFSGLQIIRIHIVISIRIIDLIQGLGRVLHLSLGKGCGSLWNLS